jgi:ubiquinone/menaquinone biosynthesis C-methylase UbiE
MPEKTKPESLEGRWDLLYRDYPEIYEEFGRIQKEPDLIDVVVERFSLGGKTVVEAGSGTGISTFKLARYAEQVIGIEIEPAMIAVARESARERGMENVRFELGDAASLALDDDSIDVAVAMTLADRDVRATAAEMERVVRPGGLALRADVAPGWYGGEHNPIITGKPRDETPAPGSRDAILSELGYEAIGVWLDQDYGSVERLVRTYGFIHSKRVIDYARKHGVTTVRWKARVRYKVVRDRVP